MSFATTRISGAKHDLIIEIPNPGDATGANVTAEQNVTATTTPKLYGFLIDCLDNPGEDVTVRLYDNGGDPDPAGGSALAHVWMPGIRGRVLEVEFPVGIPFTAGMAVAAVKGAGGGGAGTSSPSGLVKVTLKVKE